MTHRKEVRMANLALSTALAAATLLRCTSALAADPVAQIGNPTYQGNGCPDGSVSATLSPDATALSLIFDRYTVESGKSTGSISTERKYCSFQIPLTIPAGYSVTVVRVDYRGYHSLPSGAFASLQARYSFRDRRTERPSRDMYKGFQGPMDGDFLISHTAEGQSWSECDGQVELRLDTALSVGTNREGELAMATLDSADATAQRKMQYVLAWRRCNGPVVQPGQPGHPVGAGKPGYGGGGGAQPHPGPIPVPAPYHPAPGTYYPTPGPYPGPVPYPGPIAYPPQAPYYPAPYYPGRPVSHPGPVPVKPGGPGRGYYGK